MKQVTTVCPRDCYDNCALIATLDDSGRIVSMRGDPSHPMTRGVACPRGTKDHVRMRTNRVPEPFERQGEGWQPLGWEEALCRVTQKLAETLEQHGPEAVLYLTYAGNTGLWSLDIPQRLWNALGATQTDMALCSQTGHFGLSLHYGQRYGVTPEELASAGLIVFWGFNAAVSSAHWWALAREARRAHGARIAVVDPRRSESAAAADLWIQPRPGSDVALVYGVLQQLIEGSAVDQSFIEQWTLGYEALVAEASRWPLERVAEVSGVAPQQVRALAEAYARARPSGTLIGFGLQKRAHGADPVRAVSFIPTVLGQHRGWFYSNGDAVAINHELLSGLAFCERPPRIVEQVALADMLEAGQFQFVYVSGMNPALTLPNTGALTAGLQREDVFLVVHETHWTRTTEYADVVLPALTYLEKDDVVPPWSHNLIQLSPQIAAPPTDGRSEVWVMQELARKLGLSQAWLYEDPWAVVEQALEGAFESGDLASLRAGQRLRLKRKPREQYATPSGKIEFASSRAREMGFDPLPLQQPLRREPGRFVLLTSASARYTSTQFQEVYGDIPAVVMLNSRDARRLGIGEGDAVVLANDLGQVKARARISDDVPEGVLWSARQWVGLDGAPQNALMSSEPQPMGHGPRFNSTVVSVSAAS
jgi:anaerobic selenocysteine-containing dehydrogenase